jgi:hypothetical protein
LLFAGDLELHTIELKKFRLGPSDLSDPLERWSYFLQHGGSLDPGNLPANLATAPIERAMEELKMLTQDEIQRHKYEDRFRAQLDENSREKTAMHIGELKGKIAMCRQILGLPPLTEYDFQVLRWEGIHDMAADLEKKVRERFPAHPAPESKQDE